MDAGNQSSLELIKNLSLNVVKDFHVVMDSWNKGEKKRSYDDKNCLLKSLVAKYFKDAFGWAKYNSSIKRCSFLSENDIFGKLKSIKVLTYRDSMDWWQRTLSESLDESINIYNAEQQSKIVEPTIDYDTQVAMNSLGEKHRQNTVGTFTNEVPIERNIKFPPIPRVVKYEGMRASIPNFHDIIESKTRDVSKKTLSHEIEEAINFESLTNIKF